MSTPTPADFRQAFPEFADTDQYPEPMVQFWLSFAVKLLSPAEERWDTLLTHGEFLVAAHQLVLAGRNAVAPGAIAAPAASKTVDKVSVSYDTSAVTLEDAGHWGGTSYGMQFLQLARMMGAGGFQL